MKKFKEFEILTKKIYEQLDNNKENKVQHDVRLDGKDGKRQIDILIEGSIGANSVRMIVECKDYKGKVNVIKVDELDSKMKDVNAHVGILVSSKGFTGTAIKKAKRLGIKLCTVHQALSEKWEIDLDLPIIVKELAPNLHFHFQLDLEKGQSFSKELTINDVNIFRDFYQMWNNRKFDRDINGGELLSMIGVHPPYFIRDINTHSKIVFEDVDIKIDFLEIFYFGNLKELKNTLVLKNITEQKTDIIFNQDELHNYKTIFAPYKKLEDIPSRASLLLVCATYPIIDKLNPQMILTPHSR